MYSIELKCSTLYNECTVYGRAAVGKHCYFETELTFYSLNNCHSQLCYMQFVEFFWHEFFFH